MIDWSGCPDAESIPGKVSGAWCVKGTRVPVQAIIDNATAGCSPDEIASDIFPSVLVEVVVRIMGYRYAYCAQRAARLRVTKRKRKGVLRPADELSLQRLSAEMTALFRSYVIKLDAEFRERSAAVHRDDSCPFPVIR